MDSQYWVLFQNRQSWQIGRKTAEASTFEKVEIADEAVPNAMVATIAQAFQALGYQDEPVFLAIDSSLCLAATFLLENPAAKRQPQTLLYQLEQYLPLPAEDLVADFLIDGDDAFGVALPHVAEKTLLDELEAAGIRIQSISPVAMIALQHHVRTLGNNGTQLILWQHDDQLEWFRMSASGKPSAWRRLPADLPSIVQHLQVETLNRSEPLAVVGCGLSPDFEKSIADLTGATFREIESVSFIEAAMETAAAVMDGKDNLWIELRRDNLESPDPYRAVRGSLRFALTAAVALLIAMIGGFSYRAYCYERSITESQEEQAAVFHEIFPGQNVPQGIRSRLESEYAKMAGMKGTSSQLPSRTSAVKTLYEALASLPDGVRYRFRELRFDRQRAYLDGEVLSHGDADRVSTSLRNRGFQVQPPRTQQLSGQGVSVRIVADLGGKSSNAGGIR